MITMLRSKSEKKGFSSCGQFHRPPAHEPPTPAALGSASPAGKVSRRPGSSGRRRKAGVKRGLGPTAAGRSCALYAARAAREACTPEAVLSDTTTRRARPSSNQTVCMEPPDQVPTDLLAEDVLQPIARDWLMVGDGRQNRDVELVQVQQLVPDIRCGADRRRVNRPRPEHPPPCDHGNLERPPF